MPDTRNYDIAIVSDLHLSEGRHPQTRRFSRNEDFFFDPSFARFLTFLDEEAAARERKWRLIVAGDMIDFLQVTSVPEEEVFALRPSERLYGLGTSPEKTIWKLDVVMKGHRRFFRALGNFLRAGHRLAIVAGNHDVEWNVPEVRKAFRSRMASILGGGWPDADGIAAERIEFYPWFYYEPGLLWVEHGHQYDGINSFDAFLYPHLPENRELMLPGGSFFVRYLFNRVERKDPFSDNIKPLSAYLRKRGASLIASRNVRRHLAALWSVLKKVKAFTAEEREGLEDENRSQSDMEAERFDLDPDTLHRIADLWAPCFLYNRSLLKNLEAFFRYDPTESYEKIAGRLREMLGVRYVVFGHTHQTDLRPLPGDGCGEYVNAGTWTRIFSESYTDRLLREEQEAVFVRIRKDPKTSMELLRWRDGKNDCDRVNLFS